MLKSNRSLSPLGDALLLCAGGDVYTSICSKSAHYSEHGSKKCSKFSSSHVSTALEFDDRLIFIGYFFSPKIYLRAKMFFSLRSITKTSSVVQQIRSRWRERRCVRLPRNYSLQAREIVFNTMSWLLSASEDFAERRANRIIKALLRFPSNYSESL